MKTTHFPIAALSSARAVRRCMNLAPAADCGERPLIPIPMPEQVADRSMTPFHTHVHRSGAITQLLYRKEADTVYIIGRRKGELADIAALDAVPYCALSSGDEVIVMLPDGAHRLAVDDDEVSWTHITLSASAGLPVLTADVEGELSASTAALQLTGGATVSSLSQAALSALSGRLTDAYGQICSTASASGLWVQPALLMARLLDSAGNTVAAGPPVLLAPSGWQCAGEIEAAVSTRDDTVIPSLRMSAATFYVSLTMPQAIDPSAVTVEVLEYPTLHPVDYSAQACTRLSGATGALRFAATLPGATAGMSPLDAVRSSTLASLVSYAPDSARVVARMAVSGSAGRTVRLRRPVAPAPKTDNDRVASLTASVPAAAVSSGFTARCVCRSGSAVLWADVERLRRAGYSPQLIGGRYTAGAGASWLAAIEVTFADGQRRVQRFVCSGPRPVALSPLITYPDTAATEITVWTADTGGANPCSARLPLSLPAPSATVAAYISASLTPVELRPSASPLPQAVEPGSIRSPSLILLARSEEPLSPVGSADSGHGPVVALAPVGAQTSLDISRVRFHAFGPGGVMSVNANVRTGVMSLMLSASHAVARGSAVACSPGGTYMLCGNRLLLLAGSRIRSLCTVPRSRSLAWHHASESLWVADERGNITVLHPEGSVSDMSLPFEVVSLYADTSSLLLTAPSAIYEALPAGAGVGPQEVAWEGELCLPRRTRPIGLRIDMSASSFDGTLTLSAHGGAGPDYASEVCSFGLKGPVHAPYTFCIFSPVRPRYLLSIRGSASSAFQLRDASLIYD